MQMTEPTIMSLQDTTEPTINEWIVIHGAASYPPPYTDVLVYSPYDGITKAAWLPIWSKWELCNGRIDWNSIMFFTHWMPLPEPPK
jgi:hypothetical protein